MNIKSSLVRDLKLVLLEIKYEELKRSKWDCKAWWFIKVKLRGQERLSMKKEITLAKLASRNLYLDEDEFCCYKTLFKNIDR
jgi:hypothetical protein